MTLLILYYYHDFVFFLFLLLIDTFLLVFLLQYTCTYKFALAFSLPSPLLLRIESCIPTLTKWVSTIVRGHMRGCWTTRTPIYAARSQAAMTVREFHLKRCVYVCVCAKSGYQIACHSLFCFFLLCFYLCSSMVQILHTICLQLLKYTMCDLICII